MLDGAGFALADDGVSPGGSGSQLGCSPPLFLPPANGAQLLCALCLLLCCHLTCSPLCAAFAGAGKGPAGSWQGKEGRPRWVQHLTEGARPRAGVVAHGVRDATMHLSPGRQGDAGSLILPIAAPSH